MKTQCDCCGTCCRNGGPPLHILDKELVVKGFLAFADLITIRCGEFVLPPLATEPVPAQSEWIKIQGGRGGWCCRFLDTSTNECTIYAQRPSSCRALKCWQPDEILAMAGRDLLSRFDLIDGDDALLPLVQLQEAQCPVPDMESIAAVVKGAPGRSELLSELTVLVRVDLDIRARAASKHSISLASEMFYFGRPLFQLLQPLGIRIAETPDGFELLLPSPQ